MAFPVLMCCIMYLHSVAALRIQTESSKLQPCPTKWVNTFPQWKHILPFAAQCACGLGSVVPGLDGEPIKECSFNISGLPITIRAPETALTAEMTAFELSQNDNRHYGPFRFDGWALKEGDIALDIGANLGMFSILLAKRFPGVRVYSYEANPRTAALLKNNVDINDLTSRVVPHNLALSNDSRTLEFKTCSDLNIGRNGIYEDQAAPFKGEENNCKTHLATAVPSTTLSRIIEVYGISRIAVLKMDCEGCEYEVLPQVNFAMVDHSVGECHKYGYGIDRIKNYNRIEELCKNKIFGTDE